VLLTDFGFEHDTYFDDEKDTEGGQRPGSCHRHHRAPRVVFAGESPTADRASAAPAHACALLFRSSCGKIRQCQNWWSGAGKATCVAERGHARLLRRAHLARNYGAVWRSARACTKSVLLAGKSITNAAEARCTACSDQGIRRKAEDTAQWQVPFTPRVAMRLLPLGELADLAGPHYAHEPSKAEQQCPQ